jgi:hypothetical protein
LDYGTEKAVKAQQRVLEESEREEEEEEEEEKKKKKKKKRYCQRCKLTHIPYAIPESYGNFFHLQLVYIIPQITPSTSIYLSIYLSMAL